MPEAGWPWQTGLVKNAAPFVTVLRVSVQGNTDLFQVLGRVEWPNLKELRMTTAFFDEDEEVARFAVRFPALEKLGCYGFFNDLLACICECVAEHSPSLAEIELDTPYDDYAEHQADFVAALSDRVVRELIYVDNMEPGKLGDLLRLRPDFRPSVAWHRADSDGDEQWAQIVTCSSLRSLNIRGGTTSIARQFRSGFPPNVTQLELEIHTDLQSADEFPAAEQAILWAVGCALVSELKICTNECYEPLDPSDCEPLGTADPPRLECAAELRGWARSEAPIELVDEKWAGSEGRRRLEEVAGRLEEAPGAGSVASARQ